MEKRRYFSFLKFVLFSIFFTITSNAFAVKVSLTCPPQEYVLAGTESNFYFINGKSKISLKKAEITINNHGRFLDPGLPSTLKLKTHAMDVQINDDGHGMSFYCYLADGNNKRVAFTISNVLLTDLGLKGRVKSCHNCNDKSECDVSDS